MTRAETGWNAARELTSSAAVSVVMPAHDLAASIAGNIEIVHRTFTEQNIQFEIVVVDDGSEDGTSTQIATLTAKFPNLKYVQLAENS